MRNGGGATPSEHAIFDIAWIIKAELKKMNRSDRFEAECSEELTPSRDKGVEVWRELQKLYRTNGQDNGLLFWAFNIENELPQHRIDSDLPANFPSDLAASLPLLSATFEILHMFPNSRILRVRTTTLSTSKPGDYWGAKIVIQLEDGGDVYQIYNLETNDDKKKEMTGNLLLAARSRRPSTSKDAYTWVDQLSLQGTCWTNQLNLQILETPYTEGKSLQEAIHDIRTHGLSPNPKLENMTKKLAEFFFKAIGNNEDTIKLQFSADDVHETLPRLTETSVVREIFRNKKLSLPFHVHMPRDGPKYIVSHSDEWGGNFRVHLRLYTIDFEDAVLYCARDTVLDRSTFDFENEKIQTCGGRLSYRLAGDQAEHSQKLAIQHLNSISSSARLVTALIQVESKTELGISKEFIRHFLEAYLSSAKSEFEHLFNRESDVRLALCYALSAAWDWAILWHEKDKFPDFEVYRTMIEGLLYRARNSDTPDFFKFDNNDTSRKVFANLPRRLPFPLTGSEANIEPLRTFIVHGEKDHEAIESLRDSITNPHRTDYAEFRCPDPLYTRGGDQPNPPIVYTALERNDEGESAKNFRMLLIQLDKDIADDVPNVSAALQHFTQHLEQYVALRYGPGSNEPWQIECQVIDFGDRSGSWFASLGTGRLAVGPTIVFEVATLEHHLESFERYREQYQKFGEYSDCMLFTHSWIQKSPESEAADHIKRFNAGVNLSPGGVHAVWQQGAAFDVVKTMLTQCARCIFPYLRGREEDRLRHPMIYAGQVDLQRPEIAKNAKTIVVKRKDEGKMHAVERPEDCKSLQSIAGPLSLYILQGKGCEVVDVEHLAEAILRLNAEFNSRAGQTFEAFFPHFKEALPRVMSRTIDEKFESMAREFYHLYSDPTRPVIFHRSEEWRILVDAAREVQDVRSHRQTVSHGAVELMAFAALRVGICKLDAALDPESIQTTLLQTEFGISEGVWNF